MMRAASRRTGSVAFCSTLAARKQNTEGGNKDSGSSLFAAKQTSEEVWTRQPAQPDKGHSEGTDLDGMDMAFCLVAFCAAASGDVGTRILGSP